ncbi:MAG: hypothetical protein M1816_001862 [Peltula sp. TS41687]|nr:MAG: hypothetical protein M1816_001862 [Peltula sp. TS41687]
MYLQRGWRYTHEGRKLNGSLPNLNQEDTQKTDDMPRSRNGSISGKSSKLATQSLTWPFRSSKRLSTRKQSKRPSVSEPYNFRHLAHTPLSGSPMMNSDGSVENSSMNGVSINRLQVNQARELHSFRLPSSIEAIKDEEMTSSPPLSPGSSPMRSKVDEFNSPSVVSAEPHALRYSLGSEDEETTSTRSSRLVIPPPRTSSRNALTFVDHPVQTDDSTTSSPTICNEDVVQSDNEQPIIHTSDAPMGTVPSGSLDQGDWQCEDLQIPHAITTPDDSAWPLKPVRDSGSRSELADVPEEEEGYCSQRADTISSKGHSFTQLWRQASSSFDSQTNSVAPTWRTSLTSFESSIQPEDSIRSHSQYSEPFDVRSSFGLINAPAGSGKAAKKVSVEVRDLDGCWEDDIDYCYEHALEADCTYEWGLNSGNGHYSTDIEKGTVTNVASASGHDLTRAETRSSDYGTHDFQVVSVTAAELWKQEEAFSSNTTRPSLALCTVADMPDLDPTSTLSSARDSELITPSPLEDRTSSSTKSGSGLFRNPFKESGLFVMNDGLLLLKDTAGQIEEEPVEVESFAKLGQAKGPLFGSTGSSNETDGPNHAVVNLNINKEADDMAQERVPRKTSSHGDLLNTCSPKSRRERSPSESTPKVSSPTKRKVIKRNKSMSSFSSIRAPPPTRVSYALFPSS